MRLLTRNRREILKYITITVEWEENDLTVNALWRGNRVGYAWCKSDRGRLHISDLHVDDNFQTHVPPLLRLLPPCFRRGNKNFRNNGIGSMILQRVLTESVAAGIDEVWGAVVMRDIDRTLSLLDWYLRRGFTISEPDSECMDNAVKKISHTLTMASPKR